MAFLPSGGASQHPGLVLPGGGSGAVMVQGANGASYLVPGNNAGAGNYFLQGGGSGQVIVAGQNGAQYLMTYPTGALVQPQASAFGGMGGDMNAAAAAAYGYVSSANPYGFQMPQAMYSKYGQLLYLQPCKLLFREPHLVLCVCVCVCLFVCRCVCVPA